MIELPEPILRFAPILKERVWGGRNLARFGYPLASDQIGEAWLLSDLPPEIEAGVSEIVGGRWDGRSLDRLVRSHRTALLGAARPAADGGFPLLIKLLDAVENLSVQVHPTPAYAAAHPGAAVKNEAWVILQAEPSAELYIGLKPDVRAGEFRRLAENGRLPEALVAVPARVGDCHLLASGTCHALGAGIVVAEVQTPSDTTFRVHDWGRRGRQLHLDEAIECIFGPDADDDAPPVVGAATPATASKHAVIESNGLRTRLLARTDDFLIERIDAVAESVVPVITNGLPIIWIVANGDVELRAPASSTAGLLAPGHLALTPACAQDMTVRLGTGASLLRVELPSPMDSLVA